MKTLKGQSLKEVMGGGLGGGGGATHVNALIILFYFLIEKETQFFIGKMKRG